MELTFAVMLSAKTLWAEGLRVISRDDLKATDTLSKITEIVETLTGTEFVFTGTTNIGVGVVFKGTSSTARVLCNIGMDVHRWDGNFVAVRTGRWTVVDSDEVPLRINSETGEILVRDGKGFGRGFGRDVMVSRAQARRVSQQSRTAHILAIQELHPTFTGNRWARHSRKIRKVVENFGRVDITIGSLADDGFTFSVPLSVVDGVKVLAWEDLFSNFSDRMED